MIWFIFLLICGHFNQFDCFSDSTKFNKSRSEFIDTYCYELTPCTLYESQLIHPVIHDSKEVLKRSNITDDQSGIPFHLIIRLVNARTSRPLVGAYIYVWHANIYGNHSRLNQARRFKRSNRSFQEFQVRPLISNRESDSEYGRTERTDYESRDFDQSENLGQFKSSEFYEWSNQYQNNNYSVFHNQSHANSSIHYSKPSNSSYNFTFNESFQPNNSWHLVNFTSPDIETTPKYFIFENFTQPNTETSFTTESFAYDTGTQNRYSESTTEPYWSLTESDTKTEATNETSKISDTVETNELKHDANESQKHFLQGYQITNFNGDVSFITIVPGWTFNRSLHVNVHIYLNESQEEATFVGQLYFPNKIANQLLHTPLYSSANRRKLTKNHEDEIFKLNDGNSTLLTLETIGSGYQSIITLGIDPLKTIKP